MPLAVITGASRGLGAALATALDRRGWDLVVDARHPEALRTTPGHRVAGDVTDPAHRQELADTAARLGGADLLVNNASTLGASPMPAVADLGADTLSATLATNVVAPHALTRLLLPQLLAHRRHRPQPHLGRVRRALRGLGRATARPRRRWTS